jgi:hypothetical protein
VPLFHPRTQRWEAHFARNDDFTFKVGLTSTGRATIAARQRNRPRTGQFASSALRLRRTSPQAESYEYYSTALAQRIGYIDLSQQIM